ncbi:MAG: hypothetical protein HOV81_16170 [Kofleriaceae bacterium]|nr:hypothetical protein [Kofleriaceae bacterium]
MRAGLVCLVLLAIVGCKRNKESNSSAAGSQAGSAAPVALSGWKRIEALATPTVSAAPSKDLERAIAIGKANTDAWRELRFKHPPPPLSEYAQGADALDALHAWASEKGGLPPVPKPTEQGLVTLAMHDIGSVAIESATDATAASLADGLYLGTRLVQEGRNFLEVQVGLSMLSDLKRKRRMLALDGGGSAAELVPPTPDFVRVLAAEALYSRRLHDFATSPEGRKELVDMVKAAPDESKQLVENVTGRSAMSMIPTDEEAAAMMLFWAAALDGAQRGEPAATTIARAQKAAEAAGAANASAASIARILEMLKSQFDRLSDPSPF